MTRCLPTRFRHPAGAGALSAMGAQPLPGMPAPLRAATAVVLLAAAALAGGCAADNPDRYYTLASPAEPSAVAPVAGPPLFIEVAPVAVPERLAKPQMLVRRKPQSAEVELLEQSRWTSSFEKELRDALSAGISERLGAIDASKAARQAGDLPSWRITMQLTQFDAVQDDRIDAAMNWSLRRTDAPRAVTCRWTGSERVGPGIDGLAAGAQRVVAQVSAQVARQIAAAQAGNPALPVC